MCLITFAYKMHPKYRLIVVANRDEFYVRPTAAANWWNEYPNLLAGKDLKGQGTWLGITKSGRFSALTNYRNGFSEKQNAPSRGDLVKDFLLSQNKSTEHLIQIAKTAESYNGYNLLTFDGETLGYFSNQIEMPQILEKGIYGLSNGILNTPWQKINKAVYGLENLIQSNDFLIEKAFEMMQNKAIAPDVKLPNTNVPIEWERTLSAMYIETPNYGTRCTTVFLLDYDGNIHFEERSKEGNISNFKFEIE
jgi:uncharacterized protein with NRDE domain